MNAEEAIAAILRLDGRVTNDEDGQYVCAIAR